MSAYPLSFASFLEGLSQGLILGLRCLDCQEPLIPPGAVCPACGSQRLETHIFQNRGRIKTYTVIRVAPAGRTGPYIVALVELSEGGWILGNLLGVDPDKAGPGLVDQEVEVGHRFLSLEESGGLLEGATLTFTLAG